MNKDKLKKIVSAIFITLIVFFGLGIISCIGKDSSTLITSIIIEAILILSYKVILNKLDNNTDKRYDKTSKRNNTNNKWLGYILWGILAIATCGVSLIIQLLIKQNNKKKQIMEEERLKEQRLLSEGYRKIYTSLFINESDKCISINDKKYGFSQIIDCELIENDSSISNTYGNTKGKIKSNGKIKSRTSTISTQTDYCGELYLNITVDDFNNPNIKLNVRGKGLLNTGGQKYKDVIKRANEILSLFRLIISKNNEKYVEQGTITKIEHRYIEEKGYEQKLEELERLHREGILTDYEYSIKKYELLK